MGINQFGTPHLHLDCNRVDMDNCLNSDHLIGIRAKTAAEIVRNGDMYRAEQEERKKARESFRQERWARKERERALLKEMNSICPQVAKNAPKSAKSRQKLRRKKS